METCKTYTKEFKRDAVRRVAEQGNRRSEAARNPGIDRVERVLGLAQQGAGAVRPGSVEEGLGAPFVLGAVWDAGMRAGSMATLLLS